MSAVIDPDDVLALLEDGPKLLGALAGWLQAPEVVTDAVLQALRQQGQVKRVAGDRWALITDSEQALAPPHIEPHAEYEVVWSPHRDAPALTQGQGLGSSLAGVPFTVHR